ncbi:unnamed protein product [Prunus armeniaca]
MGLAVRQGLTQFLSVQGFGREGERVLGFLVYPRISRKEKEKKISGEILVVVLVAKVISGNSFVVVQTRMNTLNMGMNMMNTPNLETNLLNMSDSSDKEGPDPLAFGGDDIESEEASEYVCSEDESSQTKGLVEGLIEARMVVHEGEMAGPSVESGLEAYREMWKKYKVLEASVDRVLALAHTPEVGSSNQTSPSGFVGITVASASEGVDIRVGVPLAKQNTLT